MDIHKMAFMATILKNRFKVRQTVLRDNNANYTLCFQSYFGNVKTAHTNSNIWKYYSFVCYSCNLQQTQQSVVVVMLPHSDPPEQMICKQEIST